MPDDVEVVEEETPGTDITLEEEVIEKVDPKVAQEKITPEHPRFKEVYGKMKSLERKVEEQEEANKATRDHNAALVRAIEKLSNTTRDAIVQKNDDEADDKVIEGLNAKLSDLKAQKLAAKKAFNFEEEANIDEQILELRDEIKDAGRAKIAKKNAPKQSEVSDDDEMVRWAQSTPWYSGDGADPIMIAAAHALDKILVRDPKWGKVDVTERLAELSKRIETRFDWKNGDGKPPKKPGSVDGGGGDKGGNKNVVRLTADEVKVANLLGVSHEEYARQKQLIAGGK